MCVIPRSWLKTINPARRDVIAIFGPLIGSLRICADDMTWRHSMGTFGSYQSKIDHLYILRLEIFLSIRKKRDRWKKGA